MRKIVKKGKTGKIISYELTDKERKKSLEKLIKVAYRIASRRR